MDELSTFGDVLVRGTPPSVPPLRVTWRGGGGLEPREGDPLLPTLLMDDGFSCPTPSPAGASPQPADPTDPPPFEETAEAELPARSLRRAASRDVRLNSSTVTTEGDDRGGEGGV